MLTVAQGEAQRSHQSYLGTEHLVLGLATQDGLGGKTSEALGLDLPGLRDAIKAVHSRGGRTIIQQIIPTSRVKKVIEISFAEARRMGNDYVGTEHLLLGLLIEGEGVAAQVGTDENVKPLTKDIEPGRELRGKDWRMGM